MKAIILAAGYATRLYPLTYNTPKPLLKVAGKPIVEHILDRLNALENLEKIYIITNSKFYPHFEEWLKSYDAKKSIKIIDDMTNSNENRLGAIGDIKFCIDMENIEDDLAVVAGDNLFDFGLLEPFNHFLKRKKDMIVVYDVNDLNLAREYGIVETENGTVKDFEEKPKNPKSTLASTGIYFFTKKTLDLIKKYAEQGNNLDKSGSFIQWLYKREEVLAFPTNKNWYDIGTKEQLDIADKKYGKK